MAPAPSLVTEAKSLRILTLRILAIALALCILTGMGRCPHRLQRPIPVLPVAAAGDRADPRAVLAPVRVEDPGQSVAMAMAPRHNHTHSHYHNPSHLPVPLL